MINFFPLALNFRLGTNQLYLSDDYNGEFSEILSALIQQSPYITFEEDQLLPQEVLRTSYPKYQFLVVVRAKKDLLNIQKGELYLMIDAINFERVYFFLKKIYS